MAKSVTSINPAALSFRRSNIDGNGRKRLINTVSSFRRPSRCHRVVVRAVDTDVLIGVGAAVLGTAVGVGTLIFYDSATRASESRENRQPCFACSGTGTINCRFCDGSGVVKIDLGDGQVESSTCINCDGKGAITCTTCNGTGIQPRYLDRREFQDDD